MSPCNTLAVHTWQRARDRMLSIVVQKESFERASRTTARDGPGFPIDRQMKTSSAYR